MTSYAQQGGPTYSYEYDANGSMTTRNLSGTLYGLAYDVEGRLISVTTTTVASFVYDGDGNRVKSVVGGVTTLHVGDHYEVVNDVVRKYYTFNGQRVAMRDNGTLYWLLSDHLGSTGMAVNEGGTHSTAGNATGRGAVAPGACYPP